MEDHPLGNLQKNWEEIKGFQEGRYEEGIVAHLLTVYKLTKHKWPLLQEQRNTSGHARLTLYQFHQRFPDFPAYLAACRIPHVVKNCSLDKLFNKFADRDIMQRYETMLESIPQAFQRHTHGLVFHWPYVSRGLILHDGEVTVGEEGVRMLIRLKKRKRVLCLEPFPQFLASSPQDHWSPEDSAA